MSFNIKMYFKLLHLVAFGSKLVSGIMTGVEGKITSDTRSGRGRNAIERVFSCLPR